MSDHPIRVLIIEDDKEDYLIAKDIIYQIEESKYQVDWVSDYESAVSRVMENDHDVYLVDYNLGNRSGAELVRHLVEQGQNSPFIFLTGMKEMQVDLDAMSAGAIDYLVKDEISPNILERAIRYAIRQKNTELELINTNRTKDKLYSIIGHDLRSPLSVMLNTSELLTSRGDLSDEIRNELLKDMAKCSKTTLDLLENLLFWAKAQVNKISVDSREVDLKTVLDTISRQFETQAQYKDITIVIETESSVRVKTDENMLELILRNLVSNALKYSNPGQQVKLGAAISGKSVRLSVSD